jgi:ribosomal 50S subunit-recycling heat shock protein
MRLDNFLSDLGIIKRRTIAKELADGGHVKVNDNRAKPAHKVKIGDVIEITGKHHIKVRVLKIPSGKSVPKPARPDYFEVLLKESASADFEL